MWIIDLTFLQESARIFKENFIDRYYKTHTFCGKTFLVVNDEKNYPHLIGIRLDQLKRLRESSYLFRCIMENDTAEWTNDMKKDFNRIYPMAFLKGTTILKSHSFL